MADRDIEAIESLRQAKAILMEEIAKQIVGQEQIVEDMLTVMFSQGHCLIIGVPGLAKTLMVRTIATVMNLSFSRIQFTPDLMPSDITGTEIIDDAGTGKREFRFIPGPVFANIVLADEINRTPPKTQSALLQSMQEYTVTVAGKTHDLPKPFFVLATQNPIEQEGTYPLPEAQLDRFMYNIYITYPTPDEELKIAKTTTSEFEPDLQKVVTGDEILELQRIVRRIPISDYVAQYAVNLTRSTRPVDEIAPEFVKEFVEWGAGPRAVQYLILGAKARSILRGDMNVSIDDIRSVAHLVLRHRIITNFNAEAEGKDSMDIINMLLESVSEPEPE